jgi:carbamoyltransferase
MSGPNESASLILGLTDGITCGAALLHHGAVIAAVNEERLSRIKMAYGFPRLSIAEVMRIAGVSAGEIDLVTSATINNHFFDGLRPFDGWLRRDKGIIRNTVFGAAGRFGALVDSVPGVESLYYGLRRPVFAARRESIRSILRQEFGIEAPVEFVDHHLAHAASAYFTSGFEDALVVTMDGGGDGSSGHVYSVQDGAFEQIARTSAYNSLGNYYSYVTHLCGYKAQKHEGKITGLAAQGAPRYKDLLATRITLRDGHIKNVGGQVFLGAVKDLDRRLAEGWTHPDLAASIQQHSEEIATGYVSQFLDPDRPRDVALAGGLFANVRINQEIFELPGVKRVFVHPGMTDGGLAVGAALASCIRNRQGPRASYRTGVIGDVYLGPEYTDREIERELSRSGIAYHKPDELERDVARLLAEGRVVARFDGRMEYGPRALGNRSILYHPGDPTVNDWLNALLQRTEFMPFAPATPMEQAGRFYRSIDGAEDTARFMTITFYCTDWMRESCRGVVHVDGTARPQLVVRDENRAYHRIIEEFGRLTGIPTIVNTSFNMHEEPIVCTPGDAIRAFLIGHLDYLAIGSYLAVASQPMERDLGWLEPAQQDVGSGGPRSAQ